MKNRFTKTAVIGLLVVLIMALGAVAVFAQDDAPAETPDNLNVPLGRSSHGRDHGGVSDEALAEALGITVEELQAARQKVAADRIAQAVEDGQITQDEGNTMLAMLALKDYIDRDAIMAEALGLSSDEYAAAKEDGTLRDLLANITPAELEERMQAATSAALDEAVSANVITQEQADLVVEQYANGFGHFHGFDRHRGFGGGPRGFDRENSDGTAPFSGSQQSTAFGV